MMGFMAAFLRITDFEFLSGSLRFDCHRFAVDANLHLAGLGGTDAPVDDFAVLPLDIDGAAAAGGAGAGDRRRSSAACSTAGLDQLAAGCTYHTGIPATVAAAAPA